MEDAILLFAVALLSAGQVLQKLGAQRNLAGVGSTRAWVAALLSPTLVAAAACLVAGTALWLLVLYRMDVSRAFPFMSLGTVAVLVVSRWYLKEQVSAYRWVGVAFIAVGIALVGQT
jgi:drug/metabolite transporter (DMT)-like permease